MKRNVSTPIAAFAIVVVLLLAMAACAVVPVDESASPVESVPDDIFTTTVPTTTTTEGEPDSIVFTLTLYWQFQDASGAQRLIGVNRLQEEAPSPAQAIAALVAGPSVEENEQLAEIGVFSPLTSDVLAPTVGQPNENRIVVVTVSPEFGLRENDAAKIPLAQEVVCTLTSLNTINGVVIEDEQGEIALPDTDSETIVGAAAATNYNCEQVPDLVTFLQQTIETPEQGDDAEADAEAEPDADSGTEAEG